MCTVTIIPLDDGGVRLVTNRDELRGRAAALAPELRVGVAPGIDAAWPTDPEGGGTWVAATSEGLLLTLLNANLDEPPEAPSDRVSRGTIIPRLLGCESPGEAVDRAGAMGLGRFVPFHLVVADRTTIADLRWDGGEAQAQTTHLLPACYASSGLGDALVQPPRFELFESMVREHGATREMQDMYHAHQWADRAHLSVMMEREDARTVSTTWCEVGSDGRVRMAYDADGARSRVDVGTAGVASIHSGATGR